MEYSYKFRMYPTKEQETLITKTFGCCRYVFNHALAVRQDTYKTTGASPSKFDQVKELPKYAYCLLTPIGLGRQYFCVGQDVHNLR